MSIELPPIISSKMVLEKDSKIWGYSDDSVVEINFNGKNYSTKPINNKWEINIKNNQYGGPYTMKINDIVLDDIYIGKVFCASGQSNMELPISRVRIKYEKELANIIDKKVRFFTVEKKYDFDSPQEYCNGKWEVVTEENIDNFFATSYFFAKKYFEMENIPIGIINTAAGGAKIESWLKEEHVKIYPKEYQLLKKCQNAGYVEEKIKNDETRWKKWHKELDENDIGLIQNFTSNSYDFSKWSSNQLTEIFDKNLEDFHGSLWIKKDFYVDNVEDNYKLFFGTIKDADFAYINGVKVGETEYEYPPRIYNISKDILLKGINIVTIRIIVQNGTGKITKNKDYKIENGNSTINIDGEWHYKIGCNRPVLDKAAFFYEYPAGLYNAMLYPILNYTLTGFLWYQGESNTHNPYNYDELLKYFIEELYLWQKKKIPFALVQLPNFDAKEDNLKWEVLREKQKSILNFENGGLVVTMGMGEDNDIHPLNKKDVGESLAKCILSIENKI